VTQEVKDQWEQAKEEDHDAGLQELADQIIEERKQFSGKKRKLSETGEEEAALGAFEREAMKRIEDDRNSEKKVRGLLPIKTKDGVKQRVEEVESDEEEVEPDEGEAQEEDNDENEEQHKFEGDIDESVSGREVSVVELYVQRKELLQERKVHIGSLASNFLEAPQERIINLEKLIRLVDSDQPRVIELTVHRLAAASVLEILKDVTPGYKITNHELSGEKVKKDTLKLQKYETALLKCYKNYLLKLEKLVNLIKGRESMDKLKASQAQFFLTCMCSLLTAHPHFNFCNNILHAITPILTNSDQNARTLVRTSIEEMFYSDLRGEISFEAVKLINHLVKSRKHKVRNDVVDVMLKLRIKHVNLDKEKQEEIDTKKRESRKQKLLEKSTNSKQEKKRKKRLEVLEKELLEARGEEGKKVKERYFTETTKLMFTIYFRILKSFPKSGLMCSVLEGLSRFAHIVNIDFFSDLVEVFKGLLASGTLGYRDTLLVTGTVFAILSGQGEAINIDPTSFYQNLYSTLFKLSLTTPDKTTTTLALSSLQDMLIKRRKKVSIARVLAFTKRVGTLSLQLDHSGAVGCLSLLRQLHTTHSAAKQLLDSEHEVGNGVFDPSLPDPEHCCASNTTAWEHSLLTTHYHPIVVKISGHIVAGCPMLGERSLPMDLKAVTANELVTQFGMDKMAFNPPVQPPPTGKQKRGKGNTVSSEFTIEKFNSHLGSKDEIDFFGGITTS